MLPVFKVSKHTSRRLLLRGAACLYRFGTYLQGTVSQGWVMFIQFPYLLRSDCQPGVQPVYNVSEPNLRGLSARGVAGSYGLWTRLQGCSKSISFPSVTQGCSQFILLSNLPPGDCWPLSQPVYSVTENTSRGLSAMGANCLYGLQTYIQVIEGRECSLSI